MKFYHKIFFAFFTILLLYLVVLLEKNDGDFIFKREKEEAEKREDEALKSITFIFIRKILM